VIIMASIIKLQGKKAVTYKAVIRRKGFKTITRTFSTRTAAKSFARDTEGNTGRLNQLGGTGSRMTLGEVIESYASEYQGKDKSVPTKLIYWKAQLGDWKVSAITRQVVAEELDKLKNDPAQQPLRGKESTETTHTRTQATVNRYLSTLSQVFNLAVDKGFIETNPCRGIRRGSETSHFGRALSDDERKTLLEKCKASEWDRLYLLVSMALSTGARLSELMSLTWGDLDQKKAIARLSDTKNGSPRHLPVIPAVLEQIQKLPRQIDSTVYLFPSEKDPHKSYYSGFRKHWDAALKAAEIENFRFHDLRHSAASYLTEAGIPLVTVADILGHKTLSMVQRYSHVAVEHKQEVVNDTFKDLLG
jgi:integrase